MNEIILIELDDKTRERHLQETERWFEHVLTAQTAFEALLAKAIPAIQEPHIREALEKIQDASRDHHAYAKRLFTLIGRSPDTVLDRILGTTSAKLEEGLFVFQDMMGGAVGSWQYLHHLLLLNQQAMGAFAVAEQLGYSLGMKELVDIAFPTAHEKHIHQLLLQEYMLEMAPISILYKEDV
ncbi:hypothetical protein [Ectobacillus ponti]|uniref:Uncharacterized protein n=1 Tax=Ectobacillus ponti TaxID=2961894 RepID=A0AA41X8S3_9BACI|nr:hypothetical protein [Ectobacillus ponti]MCP8968393.1 hypothetical protein [Ectobacillus ponti]